MIELGLQTKNIEMNSLRKRISKMREEIDQSDKRFTQTQVDIEQIAYNIELETRQKQDEVWNAQQTKLDQEEDLVELRNTCQKIEDLGRKHPRCEDSDEVVQEIGVLKNKFSEFRQVYDFRVECTQDTLNWPDTLELPYNI